MSADLNVVNETSADFNVVMGALDELKSKLPLLEAEIRKQINPDFENAITLAKGMIEYAGLLIDELKKEL